MIKLVDYVAIGRRVKIYRKKANLTQAYVAEQLGVSVSYISQIECGRTDVSLKRLDDIANIIHTTIERLIVEPSINNNMKKTQINELIVNWNTEQKRLYLN